MPGYSTPLYWRGHRFSIASGNLARAVKRANRGATASELLSTALLDRDAAVLFGNRPSMDELSELAAVLYDDALDALPQDADPVELTPRERATRATAALLASGHRLDDGPGE
uniref:Uncharacterized protein n=1 Tax=Neobacillus citreus TaxID=2833578 RepID=A0A942T1H8_9BACI